MTAKRPLISRKPSKDISDFSEIDEKLYTKLATLTEGASLEALSNEDIDRLSLSIDDKKKIEKARQEKQVGKKKTQKQFQDVKFKPGNTAFDRHNPERTGSFHGFFALFWLGLGFLSVKTTAEHWRETGHFFRGELVVLYQLNGLELALTDALMVSSSVFVVLLQFLVLRGLSWNKIGWIVENIWQSFYLGFVIHRSYTQQWQWIQSVFIVLHCVVMLMKQHSYATYMGYLSEVYKSRNKLEKRLLDLRKSSEVPKLKVQPPSPDVENTSTEDSYVGSADHVHSTEDEESSLLVQIQELAEELTHDGVTYPENLTLWNYVDYLLVPSLVYDIVYPRTERIRWWYVFEKTLATFGTFGLMTMIVENYILPVVPANHNTMTTNQKLAELPWLMLQVVFPFITMYLLTFYIIFECVCQWFAEMTRFADRNFYNDWWNSLSWV